MKSNVPCKIGLLDYIAMKAGCMYVSDLHLAQYHILLARIIREIEPEDYTLIEWMDAVSYITGKKLLFDDKTKAAEFLQNFHPVLKV